MYIVCIINKSANMKKSVQRCIYMVFGAHKRQRATYLIEEQGVGGVENRILNNSVSYFQCGGHVGFVEPLIFSSSFFALVS